MKTINLELKKAIFDYLVEHKDTRNRLNFVREHFREYIYNSEGNYLIWGKEIYEFIKELDKLI